MFFFFNVHLIVCRFKQIFRSIDLFSGIECHTAADTYLNREAFRFVESIHIGSEIPHVSVYHSGIVNLGYYYHELVTAISCQEIMSAGESLSDDLGNFSQCHITHVMTKFVIYSLELIKVHEDKG